MLRDTVKKWFETGDTPTQFQFWSFIDALRFNDEKVPVNQVNGIDNLLQRKADKAVLEAHLKDKITHITIEERENWNSKANVYNLSFEPVELNYTFLDKKVFGVLLQVPQRKESEMYYYTFAHQFNIDKYLRLELWQNGLPIGNPKVKAREDLSAIVYKDFKGVGFDVIGSTPIGVKQSGVLNLEANRLIIETHRKFTRNELIYIEFTKK
ncbi:conserved hypothetical protein [Tenacibaculum sp. 190524A02b]|uniref:Uncharacterized protein n=1 Tax=Tenacibaculum vairaonense TaxID=3137860 RepID=A0ABP1FEP3_9FLAO